MSKLKAAFVIRALLFCRRFLAYDLIARERVRGIPTQRLGSADCGWTVPREFPGQGDVCFCFGAGEDISFDVALHRSRRCIVHTFDPTPRAIAHHASLPSAERNAVSFHTIGIWTENRTMQFFAPAEKDHVSHSLVSLQSDRVGFSADCKTLATLTEELGGAAPQLIKMDIEGAEMQVLDSVIAAGSPQILLVEFDELTPLSSTKNWVRVRAAIRRILARGYEIYSVDRNNYGFIRR
ncbi:FkbM family methyltransferase [Horticoccus luteus]|uniref:FkbM family methyltransferase n=1 Tax=Horticoccus luteus TaxID=2862869 RepID=A0A8F9TR82_9BACT|nr:FkbM family methyltransferase [Horticoccus luteus]QYM77520.1 FkbM family methyltransferase [Horticoccus luteus]